MSTDPTNDLETVMKALRKSRSPAGAAPSPLTGPPSARAKPAKAKMPTGSAKVQGKDKSAAGAKGKPQVKAKTKSAVSPVPEILEPYESNPSGSKFGIEDESGINLKSQLTDKELRFIGFALTGEHTREKAMELAGYAGMNKSYLRLLASKIIAKYESSAGDHRKIMRARGYGEVKVIEMLIDSAENAPTATVKLNARIALAKCLGLNNDVVETHVGVNIIITGRSQRPPEPVEGGGRPAQIHAVQPPKPLQITK